MRRPVPVLMLLAAAAASLLAACGSSSGPSPARAKALTGARLQVQRSGTALADPALVRCANGRVSSLSTARLKQVAAVGANAKTIVVGLFTDCIKQGEGTAAIRGEVRSAITGSSGDQSVYGQCVRGKANSITNDQVAEVFAGEAEGSTGVAARAKLVLGQLGTACLSEPSVASALKAQFIQPTAKQRSEWSAKFLKCEQGEAEQTATSEIVAITRESLAGQTQAAQKKGQDLLQYWVAQCVGNGIKP